MNTLKEYTPKLFIIITAFACEDYIEQTLDSVFNEIYKNKQIQCSVLLGIDGCTATESAVTKIAPKYGSELYIYKSTRNCGTYLLRNSLLKCINDKDSIVFFFDSDDILPGGFLLYYYNLCKKNILKITEDPHRKIIVRTMSLGISDTQLTLIKNIEGDHSKIFQRITTLLSERQVDDLPQLLIAYALKTKFTNNTYKLLHSILRLYYVKHDDIYSLRIKHFQSRSPHGSFFATYSALEHLGFFHRFSVGQDTDILNRAELLGIPILQDEDNPGFFRRISTSSLTNCEKYGHGSKYRTEIIEINKKYIENNKLIADKESVELIQL